MPQDNATITNSDLAAFCRQFASLTHAQVNLLDIFEALREQSGNALMREILDSVREDAEMGRTLATAFSRYPAAFSPFFISMIRQGELEGELDRVFADLAVHYESRLDEHVNAEKRRGEGALYDIQSAAFVFRWLFIWVAGLVAACLVGSGAIWYATVTGALPGDPLPNILLLCGVILLLGVLVMSVGRRRA